MSGSKRRYAQHVHVVLYRVAGSLFGCLEQRSHIYVESAIGITRCNDFGAPIVSVLPHLGNHDTRLTPLFLGKCLGQLARIAEVAVFFCL